MRSSTLIACLFACARAPNVAPPVDNASASATPPPAALGLAIVFETHHLWIGNDTFWSGRDSSRTPGHYAALVRALDGLAAAGPRDAPVSVIAYGNGARVVWHGALGALHGADIGTQRDLGAIFTNGQYVQNIGIDVAAGVTLADRELAAMVVRERRVLVIGDGENGDTLGAAHDALARDEITASVIYLADALSFLEDDPHGWDRLTGDVHRLDDDGALPDAVAAWVTPTR